MVIIINKHQYIIYKLNKLKYYKKIQNQQQRVVLLIIKIEIKYILQVEQDLVVEMHRCLVFDLNKNKYLRLPDMDNPYTNPQLMIKDNTILY